MSKEMGDTFFQGINGGEKPIIGATLPNGTRVVGTNAEWLLKLLPKLSSIPPEVEVLQPTSAQVIKDRD